MSAFLPLKNSGLSWLWLTLIWLIADQVTKQLVVSNFELFQSVNVLPFFNLTYVQNPGAAFSFLADQDGWQRWFFTVIAAVASIVFGVWLAKTPKNQVLLNIAVALMLSGALGNLIDRVLFGYVIDFLDFYIGNKHWPAFNVADSMIFIGAALMIIDSFKNDQLKKN
ncbi:MAG: signal peptidase II [Sinobacterium sp.]|jgi:signal peptidase II|tara:strand:- start:231 stop:731 length:501 start_codon:yes stop_codon:yes gene_type:complete